MCGTRWEELNARRAQRIGQAIRTRAFSARTTISVHPLPVWYPIFYLYVYREARAVATPNVMCPKHDATGVRSLVWHLNGRSLRLGRC